MEGVGGRGGSEERWDVTTCKYIEVCACGTGVDGWFGPAAQTQGHSIGLAGQRQLAWEKERRGMTGWRRERGIIRWRGNNKVEWE